MKKFIIKIYLPTLKVYAYYQCDEDFRKNKIINIYLKSCPTQGGCITCHLKDNFFPNTPIYIISINEKN